MDDDKKAQVRRSEYLTHVESAWTKADAATETSVREWWSSVAEAWQDLADQLGENE